MVPEVTVMTVMERVGTVEACQYHGDAGGYNRDGASGDGNTTHGSCDMRSSMHFDSITKFYAILTPTATISSEVREVSDHMEAYAPRAHGKGNNGGRRESCIELRWK